MTPEEQERHFISDEGNESKEGSRFDMACAALIMLIIVIIWFKIFQILMK